jgi:hypothetical protein
MFCVPLQEFLLICNPVEEGLGGDHQFEFLIFLVNFDDFFGDVVDGTLLVFNSSRDENFLFLNLGI